MTLQFAYFPGCSAKTTCSELNQAMHRIAPELGLLLHEIDTPVCTGSREIRSVDPLGFLVANARILAVAETAALPLMTVCNTCTLNLIDTQARLTGDSDTRGEVNVRLASEGLVYRGPVEIRHFLWVLLEDIGPVALRKMIKRPMRGLSVAAFYGCHITRPPSRYGYVDSRNNRSLEQLAEVLGCRPIDYSGRTECCGFHTAAANEKVAIKLTGQHVADARENGASLMLTPCPLCHTVLDTFQRDMERDLNRRLDMPILHLAQIVGLALGVKAADLGLNQHVIPSNGIIETLNGSI